MCAWDTATNSCGCPPAQCADQTDQTACEQVTCPETGNTCLWKVTQGGGGGPAKGTCTCPTCTDYSYKDCTNHNCRPGDACKVSQTTCGCDPSGPCDSAKSWSECVASKCASGTCEWSGSSCSCPTFTCFAADTQILTPDGVKSIQTLQAGDGILSVDPTDGSYVPTTVERILTEENQIVMITTTQGDVAATLEHPFLTPHGFVLVKDLYVGDQIESMDGTNMQTATITSITQGEGTQSVYNLQVGGAHTFIANGFVVHNKGNGYCGQCGTDKTCCDSARCADDNSKCIMDTSGCTCAW